MKTKLILISLLFGLGLSTVNAQKYKAEVPESITTPDKVHTKYVGELKFKDGFPSDETVKKTYEFLDVARATLVFTNTIGIGSMQAMLEGQRKAGIGLYEIAVFENLLDARSLWLTPNTTTPYAVGEIDTKNGPVVVDNPGPVLGIVDDAFFTHVTDIGFTGPDKGKGGKYLFVAPDYKGEIPDGYIVIHTRGYRHWLIMRLIVKDGDVKSAVDAFKAGFKMYPLAKADNPPKQVFHNFSGKKYSTIHANNAEFYNEINASVQYEPTGVFNPEINGQMASIGIKKGKEFKPDARWQKILTEGAAMGNASARAILFSPRNENVFFYPGKRQWYSPLAGGSHEFLNNGELVQSDRTMMLYFATGITPSMVLPKPGTGSVYEITAKDADGNYLDGSKNYKVTLPGPIPINNFWSFMINDAQTRSILETDQKSGGIDSNKEGLVVNDDGSVTVYFGPEPPKGHESNWGQTMPGKGYTILLRLYGPLKPWYDKTWMPGDLELVK
ncbi:MAG: DUF1254 domain-containing protein [Bacteroidales bacterium]|nr:DUF1254 domain-containing protein [Bacteroidales bacterium]